MPCLALQVGQDFVIQCSSADFDYCTGGCYVRNHIMAFPCTKNPALLLFHLLLPHGAAHRLPFSRLVYI